MVLVVGATGLLGGKIARALTEQGFAVRGLCRNPAANPGLAEKGIQPVQADLRQPDTLVKACEGVKIVITTANAVAGNGDNNSKAVDLQGNRALIDAAKSSGVEHFIFLSMHGVSADSRVKFVQYKYATEEYLKASGMSYTIIQPQAFIEFWGKLVGEPVMEKGKCTVFGRGNNPVSFISVEDVKQLAVLAVVEPSLRNKVIEIGGPEAFSVNQMVAKFAKIKGISPKVTHVPVPVLRTMRLVMKLIRPGLANLIGLSLFMDTKPGVIDSARLMNQYNLRQKTFAEYLQQSVKSTV